MNFFQELQQQRWDDHRFYHRSRINQSLHLISAMSFLTCYVLIFTQHAVAASLFGWIFAMWSRQIGHFFFEPKEYDEVNDATHDHKEEIKIGYNLKRKVVLLAIWLASPVFLLFVPDLFGFLNPHTNWRSYMENLAAFWLVLAVAALLFRTIHLFFIRSVQTGVVWFTKILTDPFHDVKMYHKAPFYLMRGQLIDPMLHAHGHDMDEDEEELPEKFA